ncbi:hypothetical protein GL272_22160 [Aeromonas veronii]|uniref:hypothetical protein n=1 Tax=Aeromonas veronii TaxID=654 RepID=UPI001C5ACDF3|nr:hypothetical protein [Aeromonas veronii]MBW3779578.1 hypothetical protein [Aeromonas veronii]
MLFAKDVTRTRLESTSQESIKRFLKKNSAMKFALLIGDCLLSSNRGGVPLGEFVTRSLITLDVIERDNQGFVFIYPVNNDVAVVIVQNGVYLVDEVVSAELWRLIAFNSDTATLPIITTPHLANECGSDRVVLVFEQDLLACRNTVGELKPASYFTRGKFDRRWFWFAGAMAALSAVYALWFSAPPPEPPVDHYAAYRQEMTGQPLAGALVSAITILLSTSELDSWNVDKVVMVPGRVTVTLSPVTASSPIQEAQMFAARHGFRLDFVGNGVVLDIPVVQNQANPDAIYDLIGSSIVLRDMIAPNDTLSVTFGGLAPKSRYSSIEMHLFGESVLLDSLVDLAEYVVGRPVLLDKIEFSRPADGIEYLYNVDIKSRIVGEVRENG